MTGYTQVDFDDLVRAISRFTGLDMDQFAGFRLHTNLGHVFVELAGELPPGHSIESYPPPVRAVAIEGRGPVDRRGHCAMNSAHGHSRLADQGTGDTPVVEIVPAERVDDDIFVILGTPGLVNGCAAGDRVRVQASLSDGGRDRRCP